MSRGVEAKIAQLDRPWKHGKRVTRMISQLLLTLAAFVFLIPFLGMLLTSIKPDKEILTKPITLVGSYIAWENYARAWTFFPFGRFMLNSLFVGLSTTLLAIATSSLAAYAFARIRFRGRDMLFAAYLGTLMIPQQVTIIPLYIIMRHLGWYDSYQALIIPASFTAFGTFLLRQFFLTIPYEIEEAGRIDGCHVFDLYLRLIMPISLPGLSTLAIFTFLGSWKSFLWPLVIVGSNRIKTLPLGIYMFNGQYGTDWAGLMAAASIAIVPSLIVYMIFQRNFIEGISMTGFGGK